MSEECDRDHCRYEFIFTIAILLFFAGLVCGLREECAKWRADAVKQGYGRWVASQEDGTVMWEWIKKEPSK